MKPQKFIIIIIAIIVLCFGKDGKPYLGEIPPADGEAKIFAPGIASNGMNNRDVTFMPDGKEIYFCASFGNFNYSAIMFVKQKKNGKWTKPEIAPFSRNMAYMDFEPFISPDGRHLYFLSNRPDTKNGETEAGDQDIWVVDRINDGWGEPYNLGEPVNSADEEYYPTLTKEGTIYFTRQEKGNPAGVIYRSKLVDGKYQDVEKLPEQVNCGTNRFNASISPDNSYIIIPAIIREKTLGGVDYYISFHNDKDEWSEPINMGEPINSENGREWSLSFSPDSKYIFFMSGRTGGKQTECNYSEFQSIFNSTENGSTNIYWTPSSMIEKLRPEGF